MKQNREEINKAWTKIIAKAWSDPKFKEDLLKNPEKVLSAQGVTIPSGTRVVVNENTKSAFYLTLPEKPSGELSEEKLQKIAAAGSAGSGSC